MSSIDGYKVITSEEMASLEALSIEEGSSSEAYMLQAGEGVATRVIAYIEENNKQKECVLLVGKGNNGGDAYVVGINLLKKGFFVKAYHLFPENMLTPLNQKYRKAFLEEGGEAHLPGSLSDIILTSRGVIIDGLLGTGFRGKLEGFIVEVIRFVNQSTIPILAIDIPSGVDGKTGEINPVAIIATKTFFLGLPKLGFFQGDAYNHIGILEGIDFGLDIKYIQKANAKAHLLNEKMVATLLPPIIRTRHKYQSGYVVAIAGSIGMPGAALLSTIATLRAGAGITRLFYPEGMEVELSNAPYELIKTPFSFDSFEAIRVESKRASSCLIGPGLGKDRKLEPFLEKIVRELHIPCVVDADGLFHLRNVYKHLDIPVILTPHRKEMLDLLGKKNWEKDEMINLCQIFAEENRVTLVLKGAPTFIFHPGRPALIIEKGDPGMATAGTGDVLTGIVAAFLAQKLPAREAAILAVYIHGLAGEIAAAKYTSYSMIAHDLIDSLGEAFHQTIEQRGISLLPKK